MLNVQRRVLLKGALTLVSHSSPLAWKIPWTEEPGRSMGSWRVGHNWVTSLSLFTFMHWRRKWQPTPVFLPGESQGRGEPGGLPSMGSHRVGHDWSDLAAAAAAMWFHQGSMTREEKPCTNTCIVFLNYEEKLFFLNFESSGRQSELPKEVAAECAECNFPKAQLTTSPMPFSINTSCGNRPRVKLLVFWFRFGQSIAQNCENLNLKTFRWTTRWPSLWYRQATSLTARNQAHFQEEQSKPNFVGGIITIFLTYCVFTNV